MGFWGVAGTSKYDDVKGCLLSGGCRLRICYEEMCFGL